MKKDERTLNQKWDETLRSFIRLGAARCCCCCCVSRGVCQCAEQCLGLYVSACVGAGDFNFIFNRSRSEVKKKMEGEEQIFPAEARPEWMMRPTRSKHAATCDKKKKNKVGLRTGERGDGRHVEGTQVSGEEEEGARRNEGRRCRSTEETARRGVR